METRDCPQEQSDDHLGGPSKVAASRCQSTSPLGGHSGSHEAQRLGDDVRERPHTADSIAFPRLIAAMPTPTHRPHCIWVPKHGSRVRWLSLTSWLSQHEKPAHDTLQAGKARSHVSASSS